MYYFFVIDNNHCRLIRESLIHLDQFGLYLQKLAEELSQPDLGMLRPELFKHLLPFSDILFDNTELDPGYPRNISLHLAVAALKVALLCVARTPAPGGGFAVLNTLAAIGRHHAIALQPPPDFQQKTMAENFNEEVRGMLEAGLLECVLSYWVRWPAPSPHTAPQLHPLPHTLASLTAKLAYFFPASELGRFAVTEAALLDTLPLYGSFCTAFASSLLKHFCSGEAARPMERLNEQFILIASHFLVSGPNLSLPIHPPSQFALTLCRLLLTDETIARIKSHLDQFVADSVSIEGLRGFFRYCYGQPANAECQNSDTLVSLADSETPNWTLASLARNVLDRVDSVADAILAHHDNWASGNITLQQASHALEASVNMSTPNPLSPQPLSTADRVVALWTAAAAFGKQGENIVVLDSPEKYLERLRRHLSTGQYCSNLLSIREWLKAHNALPAPRDREDDSDRDNLLLLQPCELDSEFYVIV